jgi:nitrogen regulatory protein PII-like uncharacterized protein
LFIEKTNNYDKINIIDINQILGFFQWVHAQRGVTYPNIWKNYETLILDKMLDQLNGKNLAIITHRYSHA